MELIIRILIQTAVVVAIGLLTVAACLTLMFVGSAILLAVYT